jgi:hypothetical protein
MNGKQVVVYLWILLHLDGVGGEVRQGCSCGDKRKRLQKDRSDWLTEAIIKQMYNEFYLHMVNAGVARRLDEAVWMNSSGNVVENVANAKFTEVDTDPGKLLGMKCDTESIHPQYVLFFDEAGCNKNQKKDDQNRGENCVCGRCTTPKQKVSTGDKHFAILGVTAASGEPVLCVVIFHQTRKVFQEIGQPVSTSLLLLIWMQIVKLTYKVRKFLVKVITSLQDLNVFLGKEVPYLPFSSPSGSIAGKILVAILSYLDSLKI